ncbi:MAG TPA: NAD(P)-dependent oxidoreductase [Gaiellales bacterium]|nr:NAD(P)-dependent oxidoreductase [Gaiellales bacterium]
MKVGFIGLGSLGRQLAASLLRAGFPLTVHDRETTAVAALVAAGASAAASPREVAEASDCVITCLPSSQAVSQVVAGADGVIEGLRRGGTWIEMSTNDAHEIERLATLAAANGIDTLECPVTGGVHKAAAGEITVIAAGDEAVFAAHLAVLEAMGSPVIHVGPLGKASVIKVITNMLAFIHLVAAGDALMLAKRGGLPLETAYEVIRASSGNSFVHETESQMILNGSYDIGFTLDLAAKDLGFALDLGREFGVPLELAELVGATFNRAREQYGGAAQSSQVVKLLEDALHVDLRAPGFPARLGGTPPAREG